MEQSTEVWKPVLGYEGLYSVSSHGRVRGDTRYGNWMPGRILKPGLIGRGYPYVQLKGSDKMKTKLVHRAVLEAFVGPCPKGHNANHKDGVKTNNALPNLEWVTFSENSKHGVKLGLLQSGESHHRAKLNEQQVREIRELKAQGVGGRELSRRFSVSVSTICDIHRRRKWKHI